MLHATQTLLLIAAFLVCPMRCMGALDGASVQGSPRSDPGCCSHCSQPLDHVGRGNDDGRENDSRGGAPAEDCGCGNCLCRGAVVADDDSLSFHPLELSLDQQQPAPAAARVSAPAATSIFVHAAACALPEFSQRGGRAIRISHQSLLL